MATISLTDTTGDTPFLSSGEHNSTAAKYLRHDLAFAFQLIDFHELGVKRLRELSPLQFPFALKASRFSAFEVGSAALSISATAAAAIGECAGDDADGLLDSLKLEPLPSHSTDVFVTFGITGTVNFGPSVSAGDFTFGVSDRKQIGLTTYRRVSNESTLHDAVEATLESFTVPASIDDLRKMNPGVICAIDGNGALTFSVTAQYSFFNNPLFSLPITPITGPLSVSDGGSASLSVAVTLNHDHRLTVGKTARGKLHLGVSVTQGIDVDTSFDLSAGLASVFGQHDPLAFLVGKLSPKPEADLLELEKTLGLDQTADIKSVLTAALDHGLKAAFHEELDSAQDSRTVLLYEIDLAALDAQGEAAVQAALNGNFTRLTSANLSGVTELQSVASRTAQRTHTITIHLLGLLNASDVCTYLKQSKVAFSPESGDLVITDLATAQEIKVVTVTPDPQQLRKVLLRNATLTAAYKGTNTAVGAPTLACQVAYFLKKANTGLSQMQQDLNALVAVKPTFTTTAAELMQHSHSNYGNSQIYLSLALDSDQSRNLFLDADLLPRSKAIYESAARIAMHTILLSDEPNRYRLPAFQDGVLWDKMTHDGSFQGIAALFPRLSNTQAHAIYVDYLTIALWAESMNKCAVALANALKFLAAQGNHADPHSKELTEFRAALTNASLKTVKDLDAGFDLPWGVLAINFLVIPPPPVRVRFASSLLTYSGVETPAMPATAGVL